MRAGRTFFHKMFAERTRLEAKIEKSSHLTNPPYFQQLGVHVPQALILHFPPLQLFQHVHESYLQRLQQVHVGW